MNMFLFLVSNYLQHLDCSMPAFNAEISAGDKALEVVFN